MNRVNVICGHMGALAPGVKSIEQQPTAGMSGPIGTKGDDDVVIVSALRTAIARARKGNFRETTPDTMLSAVLAATIKQSGAKYEDLGDICVGNVQLGGAYAGPARVQPRLLLFVRAGWLFWLLFVLSWCSVLPSSACFAVL